MHRILLKGGRVIDPANNFDQIADVQISDSKIVNIGKIPKRMAAVKTIDCTDKIVCPGLIDMHVHFRTPGQEHKETLGSGSLAAIMGGFTSVVCMANTDPVIDGVGDLIEVKTQMEEVGLINLLQVVAF